MADTESTTPTNNAAETVIDSAEDDDPVCD